MSVLPHILRRILDVGVASQTGFDPNHKTPSMTLSNGNKSCSSTITGYGNVARGVRGYVGSAKVYFEFKAVSVNSTVYAGIVDSSFNSTTGSDTSKYIGFDIHSWGFRDNSSTRTNGSATSVNQSYAAGDTIMVAHDVAGGKLWFGAKGTWCNSGNPGAGTGAIYTGLSTSSVYYPAASGASNGCSWTFNCQTGDMLYTIPSGFFVVG